MKVRWDGIVIFLVVVGAALGAIYWKVDLDYFNQKILWNESQSRSQLATLTHSVRSELDGFSQILDLTLPSLERQQKDYGREQVYSHFQMIGVLASESSSTGDRAYHLDQKYFLSGSSVKEWAATYVPSILQGLRLSSEPETLLMTIADPKRKPWILLVTKSKLYRREYVAILSADALQGIVDRQKGQLFTLVITNNQAQVLGHTVAEYIGSFLKEDPVVQDLISSGNGSGSGVFSFSDEQKVHGFYEQVDGSNLFVMIQTPLNVLMADQRQVKIKIVFMGLGVSLMGVAFLLMFGGEREDSALFPAFPEQNLTPMQSSFSHGPDGEGRGFSLAVSTGRAVPSSPLILKEKDDDDKKFSNLFSDEKMKEAFRMIDELDSASMPPPSPSQSFSEEAAPISETPPVNIILRRQFSRLDEMSFAVRKPYRKKSVSLEEGIS